MPIDPQFLDIDFSKQPQFVFGSIDEPKETFATSGPFYEDVVPSLSDSELRAAVERETAENTGMDSLVTRIYNQGQEGSCVANASAQAHEIKQAEQFGKDRVIHLSAISLYKRIGRSAQSGAMVSDGLDEGTSKGILPLDNPENRALFGNLVMPNTGFRTAYPSNWESVAKEFRFGERYVLRSTEGLMTALVNHHPVVVGRQGHSICYCRLMYDNGWKVKYANSWGDWGDNGYGYDSSRQIGMSANWAYAVRSVTVPKHLNG